MSEKIIIIGGGPGGYSAAIRASQLGADVTVVERDSLGGTCLNRGCIPSKIMKTNAELVNQINRAYNFGIDIKSKPCVDLQKLMERKNSIIQTQIKAIHNLLESNKVAFIKGSARIKGYGKLEVENEKTSKELNWDKLIIAVGSEPLNISDFAFDKQRIISSDQALSFLELPESILIVGAGVIGCEFASILSCWGVNVTLVEGLERVLPLDSVDQDCSKILHREMKKNKIKIMLNKTVETIEKDSNKLRVKICDYDFKSNNKEKPIIIEVDKALICVGRKADTEQLGLETINVKTDDRGWIIANNKMETSVPGVYAIGDVIGPSKVMLAHVATREAIVAAENATGIDRIMNYDVIPYAIFTMPEIANAGLTEVLAKNKGLNVSSQTFLFRAIAKAHVIGELAGQVKIVFDVNTHKILGVHIIGPHATELIAEATLAVQTGRTVAELADTIHAHPSLSEIMSEVSSKALEKGLP